MTSKRQGYLISATAVMLLLGAELGALILNPAPPNLPDTRNALYPGECIGTTVKGCVPAAAQPTSVLITLTLAY